MRGRAWLLGVILLGLHLAPNQSRVVRAQSSVVVLPMDLATVEPDQSRLERELASTGPPLIDRASLVGEPDVSDDLVTPALVEARRFFVEQRFTEMLDQLTQVEQAELIHLAQPAQRPQAATLNRLVGIALVALERPEDATERFVHAMHLDPSTSIDPAIYPPSIVAHFLTAREHETQRSSSRLSIERQASARSWIDGALVAELSVNVRNGRHYVLHTQPGKQPQARVLVVAGDASLRIELADETPANRARQCRRLLDDYAPYRANRRNEREAIAEVLPDEVRWVVWWRRLEGRIELIRYDRVTHGERRARLPTESDSAMWALFAPPVIASDNESRDDDIPLWDQWWFWTAIGAAIALVTVPTVIYATEQQPMLLFSVR